MLRYTWKPHGQFRGSCRAPPASLDEAKASRRGAGFGLAVLFAINLLNFYDRQALGPLAEPIRREFHLTDTQLGLLGTIFTLLYAVVGVPFGRLADSWSRKKLLALGMIVWSSLTGGGVAGDQLRHAGGHAPGRGGGGSGVRAGGHQLDRRFVPGPQAVARAGILHDGACRWERLSATW